MIKNLFWVVRETTKVCEPDLIVFNKKPTLIDVNYIAPEYADFYQDGKSWYSNHGSLFMDNKRDKRFSDITWNSDPIPVKLIIVSDNPDFYIQRYKDCLFIDRRISICICFRNGKYVNEKYVEHNFRISNKLFPNITEESGIIGVKVQRI